MMQLALSSSPAPSAGNQARLGPKDLIWLSLLGVASRCPTSADGMVAAVMALTRRLWSPSPALVQDCLEEMQRGGLLTADQAIGATHHGRQMLVSLMHLQGGDPTTPWGQLTMRVRLAFADLLDDGQSAFLQGLLGEYERSLASLRELSAAPLVSDAGRRWAECEEANLESALHQLRKLADGCGGDCANCPCGGAGKTKH